MRDVRREAIDGLIKFLLVALISAGSFYAGIKVGELVTGNGVEREVQ